MPIVSQLKLRNLNQAEFDERDFVVMRCAYAAQNALGRLCDERVYENDLARRVRAEGFRSVHTQVPVNVTLDGFAKEYRLDLVVDDALYELKAVSTLAPQHEAQVLHYAMLADVNHAKLLNFRPDKVRGQLLFNTMLCEKRRRLCWEERAWQPLSPECAALKEHLQDALDDWGGCLETRLYEEALIHFCGGAEKCACRIPVVFDGVELGSHAVNSHAAGLFFLVTAFTDAPEQQHSHIRRLLRLTRLRAVQWFNLNRTTVQLQTIQI